MIGWDPEGHEVALTPEQEDAACTLLRAHHEGRPVRLFWGLQVGREVVEATVAHMLAAGVVRGGA